MTNYCENKWIAEITEDDDEYWHIDISAETRDEIIIKGMKLAREDGIKSFRIGYMVGAAIPHIWCDSILVDAQDSLREEYSNSTDDEYLENVTHEQQQELENMMNDVFYEWHKKYNLFPQCFSVIKDEIIKVK